MALHALVACSLAHPFSVAHRPFAGDFAGATQLVALTLAGNRIVSVAAEAFGNLHALQFKLEDFNPINLEDKTPYRISFGAGTCCPRSAHLDATSRAAPPAAALLLPPPLPSSFLVSGALVGWEAELALIAD